MPKHPQSLIVKLAQTADDVTAAQRLRYTVFVTELGSEGALVDHEKRLEIDEYDAHYDHLLLIDPARNAHSHDHVVGVYRLLNSDRASAIDNVSSRYYSDTEFDLSVLINSGRRLLELGRSCLHKDYRGGMSMLLLWQGISDYIAEKKIDILFGVASFHGTDADRIAPMLSLLHHKYLAPPNLRVKPLPQNAQKMDLIDPSKNDRVSAMVQMPPLIKAYLRLGGGVGDGAFIDHSFNTIDICLVMETAGMIVTPAKSRSQRLNS